MIDQWLHYELRAGGAVALAIREAAKKGMERRQGRSIPFPLCVPGFDRSLWKRFAATRYLVAMLDGQRALELFGHELSSRPAKRSRGPASEIDARG